MTYTEFEIERNEKAVVKNNDYDLFYPADIGQGASRSFLTETGAKKLIAHINALYGKIAQMEATLDARGVLK
jgi:hypothetical protein